jgi:aromatic ring-opening dioxygenase LigB subunit
MKTKPTKIILHLTPQQVDLIMSALFGNSADDMKEDGEYGYSECYEDLKKKLAEKGINYK